MLDQRRGKLVLYSLTEPVAQILDTMGIGDIIPMVASEQDAQGLVAQGAS